MYKLSYYRYAEAATMTTGQYGFDRVRNVVIGRADIELEYFEEVGTSEQASVHVLNTTDDVTGRGFSATWMAAASLCSSSHLLQTTLNVVSKLCM